MVLGLHRDLNIVADDPGVLGIVKLQWVWQSPIRAFLLERGIAVRQGLRFLRAELPGILAARSDVLSLAHVAPGRRPRRRLAPVETRASKASPARSRRWPSKIRPACG
jgi:hypothetical protein